MDYTVEQVASILNVSSRTVRNLINRNRFPNAYRIDPGAKSAYRIPKPDLDAFLLLQRGKRESN
jgi:excisionase family DNA binding protein